MLFKVGPDSTTVINVHLLLPLLINVDLDE